MYIKSTDHPGIYLGRYFSRTGKIYVYLDQNTCMVELSVV